MEEDDFFNNNDPFEDIVKSFFSNSGARTRRQEDSFTQGEEEDRVIDLIESENKVYIIFELPGFSKKDVVIAVKDNKLTVSARKSDSSVNSITKTLPKYVDSRKMDHTFKNGILEVVFSRK